MNEDAPRRRTGGRSEDASGKASRLIEAAARPILGCCTGSGNQHWNNASCWRSIVNIVEEVESLRAESERVLVSRVGHASAPSTAGTTTKTATASAATTAATGASTNASESAGASRTSRASAPPVCSSRRGNFRSNAPRPADAKVDSNGRRRKPIVDRKQGLARLRNRVKAPK